MMNRVSCSDEFFIKRLTSKKKRKKERKKDVSYSLYQSGLHYNELFSFFFMIHEATRYTRHQSYKQHEGDAMEINSNLYLRITLIINYMMEENLFFNAEQCPVKHAASRFSARETVTPGRTNISGLAPVTFLSRSSIYYIMLNLNNLINPLNVVDTNIFS